MMLLRQHPMSENELRQCLRIATGATLGFLVAKLTNSNYGVFFTVTPMLLLGLVPVMNAHAARQLLAASVICGLEVGVLAGFFGGHPGLMAPLAFLLFLYRFACMSRGALFLFGANSVIGLSIMLNFASFPQTDLDALIMTNMAANLFSIAVAFALTVLIPDTEPRPAYRPGPKEPHRMRHEALLGASVATLSFLVFQLFDLSDSLSAQATTLLLLFPMHWNGALSYARKRAMGTIIGVAFGLGVQFILYDWSGTLLLVTPLLWIGTLLFAHAHVKEANGSGIGFGAMTTLGILFGQYLVPGNDLIFSGLYRVSSIMVAIVATLLACYLMHHLLNRFEATRFGE